MFGSSIGRRKIAPPLRAEQEVNAVVETERVSVDERVAESTAPLAEVREM